MREKDVQGRDVVGLAHKVRDPEALVPEPEALGGLIHNVTGAEWRVTIGSTLGKRKLQGREKERKL